MLILLVSADPLQHLWIGLAPFEVVLWMVLNYENYIVGHCFLDFNIFHIIFKIFLNYTSGLSGWNYQDSSVFSSLPLICIKSSNTPKNHPKVRYIENPFSPSACTSLFISCLQNHQIFLQLVASQPWGSAVSRKDDRHLGGMSQMERKWNAWYRWVNSPVGEFRNEMEDQGLKITFLISEKIVEIGGGRGEGHAGKNNCEYKGKKELLDVRAHLLLWDCKYTYFLPKLYSVSLDICWPKPQTLPLL